MATVNIGNIKFTWKGAYNASTAYAIDDIVSYNGSSYVCIQASTGNLPTVTAYWEQMSQKGTDADLINITGTVQGDLYYNNGSAIARLGAGTSGQFLKTQGTGANPTWANLASNVDIVSYTSLDSTGVNTLTTTTDWSTNNYWKMEVFSQYQMSASQGAKFRVRNSSGDISTDTYGFLGIHNYDRTNHTEGVIGFHRDLDGGRGSIEVNGWGFNSSNINPYYHMQIYKPDANNRQNFQFQYFNNDVSSPNYYAYYLWSAYNYNTDAKTGFSVFANNNANMKNGFQVVLGYKYQ